MRNNFVDSAQASYKKESDNLSVGSAEQKPLGVVREGFKKASFSNIGTEYERSSVQQNNSKISRPQTSETSAKQYPTSEDAHVLSFGNKQQTMSQQ
jgi:hypothetical protein